jgi:magnesium transporter
MFEKGVDHMCAYILDNEIDNYFPILENIDDEVEEIEHEISDKLNRDIMQHILKLKRTITFIKKISMPQREKLSFLAKNDYKFISEKSIPYFRDVYDHSIRVSDALDNYREAASNTFEAYMSAVNNNMNEVMKTLSVIATIALPMTAISSIYGTNFEFLPGIHSHYGFIIMIGAMMVIVIMMMIFFKRRGWF